MKNQGAYNKADMKNTTIEKVKQSKTKQVSIPNQFYEYSFNCSLHNYVGLDTNMCQILNWFPFICFDLHY